MIRFWFLTVSRMTFCIHRDISDCGVWRAAPLCEWNLFASTHRIIVFFIIDGNMRGREGYVLTCALYFHLNNFENNDRKMKEKQFCRTENQFGQFFPASKSNHHSNKKKKLHRCAQQKCYTLIKCRRKKKWNASTKSIRENWIAFELLVVNGTPFVVVSLDRKRGDVCRWRESTFLRLLRCW